jgi:hypothetical protein
MKRSKDREKFVKGDETDIVLDSDDTIESMFRNEANAMQNDIKELFHEDKVKARTDISVRQVKLVTKAYYLAKLTGLKEINLILSDFLTLSISKDRKSRAEYVEGLKAKIDNAIQQGAMNIRGQFGR